MKKLFITALLFAAVSANAQDPAYPPAPAAPLNVVKAEYFIDTDPGFGLGTDIPLTAVTDIPALAATINTAALTAGAHKLCIRTLNAEGIWSVTTVRQFVIDFDPAYPTNTAPLNVVKAEYFIDTDPGFGNGTNIPLTAATDLPALAASVNTSALTAGAHRLYVRTLNAEGEWGITSVRQFAVDFDPVYPAAPSAPQNITSAEYFIDADPGFGNGTAIPVVAAVNIAALAANINTNLLPAGAHRLYIRTRSNEGKWSVTSSSQFIVNDDPAYPLTPAAAGNIVAAEYFIDTDPGFGNATPVTLSAAVDISNFTFSVNTASLTAGLHKLYVRTLDDWSITSVREFNYNSTLPLRFLLFSGQIVNEKVQLNWKTDNEVNTSHFEIERSNDGSNFEKIGRVNAVNNPGVHQYSFTDALPLPGANYYRLKQLDTDQRFVYSAVVTIRINSRSLVSISPNPAANSLQLKGVLLNTPLKIFDAAGKLLLTTAWNGAVIDVSKLPTGLYTLQVKSDGVIITKQFIKQ